MTITDPKTNREVVVIRVTGGTYKVGKTVAKLARKMGKAQRRRNRRLQKHINKKGITMTF